MNTIAHLFHFLTLGIKYFKILNSLKSSFLWNGNDYIGMTGNYLEIKNQLTFLTYARRVNKDAGESVQFFANNRRNKIDKYVLTYENTSK